MKLSDLKIKKLKATGRDYTQGDGNNLYIRVDPNGNKSFLYIYTKDKKRNVVSLGKYPVMSLQEAREESFRIKKDIKAGRNPKIQNDESKNFKYVAEKFIENCRQSGLTDIYIKSSISRLELYAYPVIGNRDINTIEPLEIISILQKLEKKGTLGQRDRLRFNLNMVFKYAIAHGLCLYNPVRDISLALIKKEEKNLAFIDPVKDKQAFKNLISDCFNHKNQQTREAFKLLIYTGLRPLELLAMEWGEIEESCIRIKPERMKMRYEHIVPLSRQAKECIARLEYMKMHDKYIFVSSHNSKVHRPRNHLNSNLQKILGYDGKGDKPKQTAHGFRHIISTSLYEMARHYKWRSEAIEMVLAHREKNKVKATYNKYDYLEEREEMLQVWADYLDELIS
ncbi:tyrosine-type recombinase/integrase [Candidatus Francisella endociliophora]|uniref:tyrosine-type recombinase/integrase n=1 Tax=Candidatus Francisella endociliophora TaxID=653937 RepID=UPI000693C18E|nr:integrase arm-type DNA-binding domain-containing protein [Francisella sp. FSC1006]